MLGSGTRACVKPARMHCQDTPESPGFPGRFTPSYLRISGFGTNSRYRVDAVASALDNRFPMTRRSSSSRSSSTLGNSSFSSCSA